ncbi:unnamed protein product [Cylindrotheca closterium]|uniref:Uncharacterized protein n=1 Tax=Cylindrotheca closterium TaxID=2856 RepID=A0AAD2FHW2_9STRA|nr:unnamed protein product [Cylindrotheca closterium]
MSRANCITAESYYQASLDAIDATFQNVLNETSDPLEEALFRETQVSLIAALEQVAQPMNDSEYQALVNAYHETPYDQNDDDDDEYEGEMGQQAENTIQAYDDEQEEELDEEDLLDVAALKEAKAKRQQIRALSNRVARIRQRVLDRVATTTEKECLMEQPTICIEKSPDLDIDKHSGLMQSSLQNLNNILKDSTWQKNLPQQTQRMQKTMKSIQYHEITNHQLSQTETAILSQTNDRLDEELEKERLQLSQTSVTTKDPVAEDGTNASPEDRLATFMQDYF